MTEWLCEGENDYGMYIFQKNIISAKHKDHNAIMDFTSHQALTSPHTLSNFLPSVSFQDQEMYHSKTMNHQISEVHNTTRNQMACRTCVAIRNLSTF